MAMFILGFVAGVVSAFLSVWLLCWAVDRPEEVDDTDFLGI